MKRFKVIAVALAASAAPLVASGANASAANASLATCSAHYANTDAWIDCYGGTEPSFARIGVRLEPFGFIRHGSWFLVPAGQHEQESVGSLIGIEGAWINVRPY